MAGKAYAPITETHQLEAAIKDHDDAPSSAGCGCFRRFCFGWKEGYGGNRETGASDEVVVQVKKLREFSETVAGPKWKNFIRRAGKYFNPRKSHKSSDQQGQYTPASYALNFSGDGENEDGALLYSFSSRFPPHTLINNQQTRTSGL